MEGEISAPAGSPVSNYIEYMITNWLDRMVKAEAAREWHQYYTYCTNALQLVKSHINIKDRAAVQRDWVKCLEALNEAESVTNEQVKKDVINKIKKSFGDTHKFYISDALPGMGIIKNEDDGVIDFNGIEFEKVTKIVRSDRGVEEAVRDATE